MKIFLFLQFAIFNATLHAQNFLKPGKYKMSYSYLINGVNVGGCNVEINTNSNKMAFYVTTHINNSNEIRLDTTIVDATTFAPVYRSSLNKKYELKLKYGKEIDGYYLDRHTMKRILIKENATVDYVDNNSFQYFLATLPLTTGYKRNLNLYEYQATNTFNIKKLIVNDVKNDSYNSKLSGEHKVWCVTVAQEDGNDNSVYYIDQATRRIWEIDFDIKGIKGALVDKESDYNPYHNKFDKEETLRLVNGGKSIIDGQVFARQSNGSKIQIINVQKKQVASKGATVVLIPYTPFFKEWYEQNKNAANMGQSAPLPEGASECIKSTQIYDNEGHFEFHDLMPGDYLLFAKFNMTHDASHTQVTGYTDTYINGIYQGSQNNTSTNWFKVNLSVEATKVATIKQDGEKITIKLKKWE